MLLTTRRTADRGRPENDEGFALAAVVGIMAVCLLVTALIVSSTTGALNFASAARAGVQAQAAADAGVAMATAELQKTTCATTYSSTVTPIYSATVWSTTSTAATPAAGDWINACPTSASTKVRIISRGTASALGAAVGQSGQDTAVMEAVYGLIAVAPTTTTTTTTTTRASGPALYIQQGAANPTAVGALNRFSVTGDSRPVDPANSATVRPAVRVDSANLYCRGGSSIAGEVVAESNVALEDTCKIFGSISAKDDVIVAGSSEIVGGEIRSGRNVFTEPSTRVGGLLTANGTASVAGTITRDVVARGRTDIRAGAVVNGFVRTDGPLVVGSRTAAGSSSPAARIDGSATTTGRETVPDVRNDGNTGYVAPSSTVIDSANIYNDAKILGDLTITGSINSGYVDERGNSQSNEEKKASYLRSTGIVGGAFYRNASPTALPAVVVPAVPDWVDFRYDVSTWEKEKFSQETWPSGGACTVRSSSFTDPADPLYPFLRQLIAKTTPSVVNALGCPRLEFLSAGEIKLKTDIAFIANGFAIRNTTIDSDSTAERRAWFIVPDQAPATAGRNCPSSATASSTSAGQVEIDGGSRTTPAVRALVYTPCKIWTGSMAWRGQFYAHQLMNDTPLLSSATLTGAAVGIPGYDLDGEGRTVTTSETATTVPYSGPRSVDMTQPFTMRNRMP